MTTRAEEDLLLTPLDASRILNVSSDSVRVYADKGKLPSQRTLTGRRLFRRSDVEAFAKERSQEVKKKAPSRKAGA